MIHNRYLKSVGFVSMFVVVLLTTVYISQATADGNPMNPSKIYGPDTVLIPWIENVSVGFDQEMAIGPTGTVSIVYSAPWEEGHNVMYVDNATGSWSEPLLLWDPTYVNYNEKDIAVDGNGDVHIVCEASGGTGLIYISNKSGSWLTKAFNPGGLGMFSLAVDSTGDHVYFASIGWDNGEIKYCNATYTGTTISSFTVRTFDFSSVEIANVTSFTDIAVNSTGHAYIVFRGFKDICSLIIAPNGDDTGPTVISYSDSNYMSYCDWPEIYIDDTDVVHVIYQRNKYADKVLSGLYYVQLNSTSTPADAYKISTEIAPGGQAHLTVDNNNNPVIAFGFSNPDQVTNTNQQIAYLTNQTGSWQNNQLTNFSSNIWARDVEVNPLTNESVILVRNGGTIEVMSMKGGVWGTTLEYTAEISSLAVPYQDNAIKVNITVTNLDSVARDFNTVMKINEPISDSYADFLNPEGNSQAIGTLAADEEQIFEWEFHYDGGGNYYVEVGMVIDEEYSNQMYFSVLWIVTIQVDIPAADTLLIIGMIVIGSLYLFIRNKRKINN